MNRVFLLALGLFVLRTSAAEPGPLLIVGGGNVPDGVFRRLVEFGGGENARMLVVPFASSLTNAGESGAEEFRSFGARSIEILSATNRGGAQEALERATVIWFAGGDQARLMTRLKELGLVELIRKRHAQGMAAGGTSAGAAVMSKIMIAGSNPDGTPIITEGLGLWPEVIVDQHFVARGREMRLRRAVELHPELPGVGIDEDTAVVVRGNGFEVIGQSTVTVIDARRQRGTPEKTVISAPKRFSLTGDAKRENH